MDVMVIAGESWRDLTIDAMRPFSLIAETPLLPQLFFNVPGTALGACYGLESASRRAAMMNTARIG